ncbi:hypothetical protein [Chitinophaga caseinilytica]|uniref:DUF1440 domain-containing protein n=1 Tax=Chitinophaga caseinilytica TaxID=2267521 RepID=A0ABZ2Z797_9BACT
MPTATSVQTTRLLQGALYAGLLVWLLDGTAAVIQSNFRPDRVFKYVASAGAGPSAFEGGNAFILLGLFFHFLVAYGWSLLFFWAYPRLALLQGNRWLTGLLYGLVVWACMRLLIVPLTLAPVGKLTWNGVLTGMAIHMVCVGLPIALSAYYWYRRPQA